MPIAIVQFLFLDGCTNYNDLFLSGWCGAGGDHYEPLVAQTSAIASPEKVAIVL